MPDHKKILSSSYDRIQNAASHSGFSKHQYGTVEEWPLWGFTKENGDPNASWIYISAGVHGDEPAPVLALVEMWESNTFGDEFNWLICPIVNPIGLSKDLPYLFIYTKTGKRQDPISTHFRKKTTIHWLAKCSNPWILSFQSRVRMRSMEW